MQKISLLIDIGNTKIAASAITHQEVLTNLQTSTWDRYIRRDLPKIDNAIEHLAEIEKLVEEIKGNDQIFNIGISFGGPVSKEGKILLSHSVPGWENIDLAKILSQKYSCKVFMDNDANVAALGEYTFGLEKPRDMMYITYSTGIGGGLIINGKIWTGYQGLAGEIGHMLVDPSGPRWWGDRKGSVYRISSGTYIAKRAQRWLEDEPFEGQILKRMVNNDYSKVTAKIVAQAAEQGDTLAWQSLEYSAWAVGTAIANTANILNIPLFVIGGSVVKAGDKFWNHILETAQKSKMPEIEFDIIKAKLGDEAPLWGALALTSEN
ncbi:MAG: ROK family protein [bacterium]